MIKIIPLMPVLQAPIDLLAIDLQAIELPAIAQSAIRQWLWESHSARQSYYWFGSRLECCRFGGAW